MGTIWGNILLGMLVSVLIFVVGIIGAGFFVVRLPATYFLGDKPAEPFWGDKHPVLRWTARILKNLGGFVAVVVGVILALPGIPGPGLLVILLGLTLLDFPGKRRLERWIIGQPAVRGAVDRVRLHYGKPPLVLEEGQKPTGVRERHEGAGP